MVFQSYLPLDQVVITQFKSDLQRLSMDNRIPVDYKEQLVKLEQSFQFIEKGLNNLEVQSNFLVDLADTSQLINSTLQIDEILSQVMDTIIRITGAERCFLALNDPAGNPDIRIARNWEKRESGKSGNSIQPNHHPAGTTKLPTGCNHQCADG